MTPPNLLGTERRIAYANRKYHSGWIWVGVIKGLAWIKFSGSPDTQGNRSVIIDSPLVIKTNLVMSLIVKYGWNGSLSVLADKPKGLFDPVWWRKSKWVAANLRIMNGTVKWKAKNRVKVAASTANPPHIHVTMSCPIYGIAENKLVITVAAQKDIWPQGSTYPIKAVAMVLRSRTIPINQVVEKTCEP